MELKSEIIYEANANVIGWQLQKNGHLEGQGKITCSWVFFSILCFIIQLSFVAQLEYEYFYLLITNPISMEVYQSGDKFQTFSRINCPSLRTTWNVGSAGIIVVAIISYQMYEKVIIVSEEKTQFLTKAICYVQLLTFACVA